MPDTDIGGIVSSLRVVDEFTAPIAAALDQIAELQAALERFKDASAGMSGPFTRLGNSIARAQKPLADLAAKLDGLADPINAAADRLAAVQDRTAAIAASSAEAAANFARISTIRAPSAPGARTPASGGNSGSAAGSAAGNTGIAAAAGAGGGFLSRLFHAPTMMEFAGAFLGYEAFKEALQTQYHVAAGVQLFDPAAAWNAAAMSRDIQFLSGLARQSAIGTIYTEQQTAQAFDMLAAMLATAPPFQGPDRWQNFAQLAPIVLRASEVATMRGLGSLQANMEALTWYAHVTGAYDPASMIQRSDQLLAIAERTGVSLPTLERTMSYSVPIARAAHASMSETALLTAALVQGGLGSRAGIAVGQIISGLLQTGGPITAALGSALQSTQQALGADANSYTGRRLTPHVAALHALGLLDNRGNLAMSGLLIFSMRSKKRHNSRRCSRPPNQTAPADHRGGFLLGGGHLAGIRQ
ncbi:MAG TPA: hypothetical protein VMA37_02065 [Acetobacteraceae bacterium]|nr:hypothetical protein [Acetobacteraceae bacterium]